MLEILPFNVFGFISRETDQFAALVGPCLALRGEEIIGKRDYLPEAAAASS